MKVGITGLSLVGKTTLFLALTEGKAKANFSTVNISDKRLKVLSEIFNPPKVTSAQITLYDVDLNSAKEFDTLAVVLGVFKASDQSKEWESLKTEMLLKDLEILQSRLERIEKEMAKTKREDLIKEKALLMRCKEILEKGDFLRNTSFSEEEVRLIKGYQLLTKKPQIFIANLAEGQKVSEELKKSIEESNFKLLQFYGKLELEILQLNKEERAQFLKEFGLKPSTLKEILVSLLKCSDLISFFTVNEKELRAWLVKKEAKAPEAAGVVHSDMERGFIKAEVIGYDDLISCGSFTEAKKKSLLRLEGKDYTVVDGDIMRFRFSI